MQLEIDRDALLQALEKHLGKDWNFEVQQTWTLAYQAIAGLMAEGAETVRQTPVVSVDPIYRSEADAQENSLPMNARSTNSADSSSFNKVNLLIGIGIVSVLGYVGWSAIQAQKTNSTQPIQIEQSR